MALEGGGGEEADKQSFHFWVERHFNYFKECVKNAQCKLLQLYCKMTTFLVSIFPDFHQPTNSILTSNISKKNVCRESLVKIALTGV